MDFNEDLYDKIQDYLDKKLSPAETREFESAIAADEELAREVQLHADMQELLADTPENDLRKNLEKLSAEAIEDSSGFDWRLLALIPIIFAIIGFLMFGTKEDASTAVGQAVKPNTVDSTESVARQDSLSQQTKTDSLEIKTNKVNPPKAVDTKEKRTKKKTNTLDWKTILAIFPH